LAPQAGFEPATLRLTATLFKTTGHDSRQRWRFSLVTSSAGGNPRRPVSTPDCPEFVPFSASGFAPEGRRESTDIRDGGRTRRSPVRRCSRQADTSWFDYRECTAEPIAKLLDHIRDGLAQRAPRVRWKPNEDDSAGLVSAGVREQSEVFVFGEKNPLFAARDREDHFVLGAAIGLYDCGNVVAGRAQSGHDGKVATLVGEKPHALPALIVLARENHFFLGDRVGREAHRGVDVLACELGIAVEQVDFGCAFAQFPQDQLHRDAGTADDRLTQHDPRIPFYPIGERHSHPLADSTAHPLRCSDILADSSATQAPVRFRGGAYV